MSIAANHWAYNQLELSGIAKNILANLAFRANDNLTCFPSVPRIARDVGCSERSVQKKIKELEQLGLVERIFRKYEKGGNRSNLYRIVGFADRPLLPPQKTEPAAQPISERGSPSYSDKVHQAGEQVAPINKTQKNTLKKTTTAPPENPPIVEPVVVVTEKAVLPTQPITATALPDIMPDLTVLNVLDEKEKNTVTKKLNTAIKDTTIQAVILFMLKNAIARGIIEKTPFSYVLGLINLEIKGLLVKDADLAKMKTGQSTAIPITKQTPHALVEASLKAERIMRIRNLAAKHPECIEEMKDRGKFTFPSDTRYMYTAYDFREAGLI
jgi:hypothetical protein